MIFTIELTCCMQNAMKLRKVVEAHSNLVGV